MSVGQFGPAARLVVLLTLVLGVGYPVVVLGVGQLAFHGAANGSLVHRDQQLVGSSLVGQSFTGRRGYFQSRPSAAGDGYDPTSTSASNLAVTSPELRKLVAQRRAAAAKLDDVAPSQVAPDALYASGSGIDPHISPTYAEEQVRRVAQARSLSVATVRRLVADNTTGRTLGFLGEPRVNVVTLNLALDASD